MPLTSLQLRVLRLLAGQRSPESYIAGGIAINRDGPPMRIRAMNLAAHTVFGLGLYLAAGLMA